VVAPNSTATLEREIWVIKSLKVGSGQVRDALKMLDSMVRLYG